MFCKFVQLKAFVSFRDDLIDHGFCVLRALPDGQLSIRSRAFMQNSLDVRHLALAAELVHLRRDELQDLVDQTTCIDFAASTEINQLSVEAIA